MTHSPSYAHVENTSLRGVLSGNILAGSHILAACLDITQTAVAEDARNEDVRDEVYHYRNAAVERAGHALAHGNNSATLEALRECWAV